MSDSEWRDTCHGFVGRTENRTDNLFPNAANALLATLNDNPNLIIGDPVPSLFHWLYFNEPALTDQLKVDGHEKLGAFLPPVIYPRRMWASSAIDFHDQLLLGEETQRLSTIKSVEFKSGASGELCFVDVEHQYHQRETLCLTDVHTIVYRDIAAMQVPTSIKKEPNSVQDTDAESLGSIVLFRYSALTFNSHRIHYDHDYCRDVEGYPGLVVHGPLMATLMVRHMRKTLSDHPLSNFNFRALAPVFAGDEFTIETEINSGTAKTTLLKADGTKAMCASAVPAS